MPHSALLVAPLNALLMTANEMNLLSSVGIVKPTLQPCDSCEEEQKLGSTPLNLYKITDLCLLIL